MDWRIALWIVGWEKSRTVRRLWGEWGARRGNEVTNVFNLLETQSWLTATFVLRRLSNTRRVLVRNSGSVLPWVRTSWCRQGHRGPWSADIVESKGQLLSVPLQSVSVGIDHQPLGRRRVLVTLGLGEFDETKLWSRGDQARWFHCT